jgi:hypothetical protein
MWIVFDGETGAQIGAWLEEEPDELIAGQQAQRVPPSAVAGISIWRPALRGFVDVPHLDGLGILGLYTTAQHARARRMLFATYPAGHEWAGQLVDPDGLTQRLIDATLALREPISTASDFHQQGTLWMRAIGAIESDVEAARIAAGITPEQAAGL